MGVCYEAFGSRDSNGDSSGMEVETRWYVLGVTDDAEARDLLLSTSPSLLYSPPSPVMLTRRGYELKSTAADTWECSVTYATPGYPDGEQTPLDPNAETYSFDTTGATAHVDQTKETLATYKVNAADQQLGLNELKGAIGVSKDGVAGTDIVIPQMRLVITRAFPYDTVTLGYVNTIAQLTGKINSAPWRGFQAEQVLFEGASGSSQADGSVPITFNFRIGENRTDLVVAGVAGIAKKAWEYLWVMYHDVENLNAKQILKQPKHIFIERLYDRANFALLGLG